jgi:hypothetical protein
MGLLAWPVSFVLPAILLVAWLLLWKASRRARLWFLVIAVGLSALCFPLGFVGGGADASGSCRPPNLCYSAQLIIMWANCFAGLLTSALLAAATLAIEGFRAYRRRAGVGPGGPQAAQPQG